MQLASQINPANITPSRSPSFVPWNNLTSISLPSLLPKLTHLTMLFIFQLMHGASVERNSSQTRPVMMLERWNVACLIEVRMVNIMRLVLWRYLGYLWHQTLFSGSFNGAYVMQEKHLTIRTWVSQLHPATLVWMLTMKNHFAPQIY